MSRPFWRLEFRDIQILVFLLTSRQSWTIVSYRSFDLAAGRENVSWSSSHYTNYIRWTRSLAVKMASSLSKRLITFKLPPPPPRPEGYHPDLDRKSWIDGHKNLNKSISEESWNLDGYHFYLSIYLCICVLPTSGSNLKGLQMCTNILQKRSVAQQLPFQNGQHFNKKSTSLHHTSNILFLFPLWSIFHFHPKKNITRFSSPKKNKKAAPHVVWEVFDIVPLEVPKLHRPSLKVNDIKVLPNRNQKWWASENWPTLAVENMKACSVFIIMC